MQYVLIYYFSPKMDVYMVWMYRWYVLPIDGYIPNYMDFNVDLEKQWDIK